LPQGTDLKSVRTAVQQHGGSMTLHWENNWCTLRILFPLPQKQIIFTAGIPCRFFVWQGAQIQCCNICVLAQ